MNEALLYVLFWILKLSFGFEGIKVRTVIRW